MQTQPASADDDVPSNEGTVRLVPRPDWQRERLRRWLREWRLFKAWEADSTSESDAHTRLSPLPEWILRWREELIRPFDPLPQNLTGLVRILPGAAGSRPVIVAILSSWDNGLWLAAPFSLFTEPATTGELLLPERLLAGAQVLCLWNALTLTADALHEGWNESVLNEIEVADALQVFSRIIAGQPVPDELNERTGPPIVVSHDPRIAYQTEETERLAGLRATQAGA